MVRNSGWMGPASLPARFVRCRDGNIAIIFGLTLIPLLFLAGSALDYSGAADLKTKLQVATDGAVMQLCQIPGNPTQAQLDTAAQTYMQSYMGDRPFTITSVIPTNSPRQIQLTTAANFQTAIVRAFNTNFRTVPVNAVATCNSQQQTYEIALVLDNTGSMNGSGGGTTKIQAARTAAVNFVNSTFADPYMASWTKISLVPFAAAVALPQSYKTANWVDTLGKASYHWNFLTGGAATGAAAQVTYGIKSRFDVISYLKGVQPGWGDWNGCFESLPYPLNVQDVGVTSSNKDSYYVPMFAPDETGNGGQYYHTDPSGRNVTSPNTYIDDSPGGCAGSTSETVRVGATCKYISPTNATAGGLGPNAYCTTRPLTRLTTSQTTLVNEINAMVANGSTNIHEGFMWGWRTLSPSSVLTDGVAYNTLYNHKVIVLMTDGQNTWTANNTTSSPASYSVLKSAYSAYGYFQNPDGTNANGRIPPGNANPSTDANGRAALDALLLEGCQNARNAGVVIYTVGFSVSGDPIDQQGIDLLRACSNNSSQSFIASDATALDNVFQQIQKSIGRLRLAK